MKAAATRASEAARPAPTPAFRIGPADDAAERAADAIAERVLGDAVLRRKCAACEEEERLSRRADGGSVSSSAETAVRTALSEPGQALRPADAGFFGARLGAGLDDVRVHDGPTADRAARSVGARAFALGNALVFARGEYRPDTPKGRQLLAHELAHVVQDEGGSAIRRQPAPAPRTRVVAEQGVTVFVRPSCATTPGFSFEIMEDAIRVAIDTIINDDCIEPTRRRAMTRNIQRHGLDFRCRDSADLENPGACAEATGFSRPANIFTVGTAALDAAACGPLAGTIMHEIIHVVRGVAGEQLPRSCELSCFGFDRGGADAELCRDIDVFGRRRGAA
ncbi:eCIS core domain-containing protein [Elioraea sp.]|uniref:eCIS core domain-containing protein n=1 Tax=Elioraea sp. TaxID=2185103 RepID=UPI003F6FD41F